MADLSQIRAIHAQLAAEYPARCQAYAICPKIGDSILSACFRAGRTGEGDDAQDLHQANKEAAQRVARLCPAGQQLDGNNNLVCGMKRGVGR